MKGIGVAGTTAIGSTGVGVAKSNLEGSSARLNSEPVQSLLGALGNPSVNYENAEEIIPKIEGEKRPGLMTTAVFPTEIGDIQYVTTEGNEFAYFIHNPENKNPDYKRGKIKAVVDVPPNVSFMILAQGDEITVTRDATPREKAQIARETRIDTQKENTRVLKATNIDGFRVVVEESDSSRPSVQSEDEAPVYYYVSTGNNDDGDETLSIMSTGRVTTKSDVGISGNVTTADCSTCNSCTAWCVACLGAIGTGCGPCSYALYTATTPVGAAVYVSCALVACGIAAPISCTNCLNCSPYV